MGRPNGETKLASTFDSIFTSCVAQGHRAMITDKISDAGEIDRDAAELPSVHLRWALEQLKTRGWTNEDWGNLFEDYADAKLGDGPVCILESIRAPFDSPSQLKYESIEQKYLRAAFRQMLDDGVITEVPIYISEWNDAQETFEPIEAVLMVAIILAEGDERAGVSRFRDLTQVDLMLAFAITKEAVEVASRKYDEEARQDAERRAQEGGGDADDFFSKLLSGGLPGVADL